MQFNLSTYNMIYLFWTKLIFRIQIFLRLFRKKIILSGINAFFEHKNGNRYIVCSMLCTPKILVTVHLFDVKSRIMRHNIALQTQQRLTRGKIMRPFSLVLSLKCLYWVISKLEGTELSIITIRKKSALLTNNHIHNL